MTDVLDPARLRERDLRPATLRDRARRLRDIGGEGRQKIAQIAAGTLEDIADRDERAAQSAPEPLCEYCNGEGDVHSIDGEWRGICTCPAGLKLKGKNAAPVSAELREALGNAWTDFLDANPDDLTSPEDWPDHALMTGEQFEQYALAALLPAARRVEAQLRAALQAADDAERADSEADELAHRASAEGWDELTGGSHINSAFKRASDLHQRARELRREALSLIPATSADSGFARGVERAAQLADDRAATEREEASDAICAGGPGLAKEYKRRARVAEELSSAIRALTDAPADR